MEIITKWYYNTLIIPTTSLQEKRKRRIQRNSRRVKFFFPANFKQKETQMFIKGSVSLYYWYSSLRDSEFKNHLYDKIVAIIKYLYTGSIISLFKIVVFLLFGNFMCVYAGFRHFHFLSVSISQPPLTYEPHQLMPLIRDFLLWSVISFAQ